MEILFLIAFLIAIALIVSFSSPSLDRGVAGERQLHKRLVRFEDEGKLLSNIYIPKMNGGTTEIDLVLIHPKGLFVFESKNYSGWIFGNEAHQNWTQTLPKGWNGDVHKERFYNPILQNAAHIKHLMHHIEKNFPAWSIIVFSDECEFKNITVSSKNVHVVQYHHVESTVEKICNETQSNFLTEVEVNDLYNFLLAYTNVTKEEKELHAKRYYNISRNP